MRRLVREGSRETEVGVAQPDVWPTVPPIAGSVGHTSGGSGQRGNETRMPQGQAGREGRFSPVFRRTAGEISPKPRTT